MGLPVTSDEWIDYLVSQTIPGYGQELSRVEPLFKKLNFTRLAPTIITVTGTNGKGSVVKALESIYLAAGYRVASVTSPHLLTIHERLTLNGDMVSEERIQQAFSYIESCRDPEVAINYFDFIHLAWFYLIDEFKPDIAILEVGCGGRLDIANLWDADVLVITSIDLDHTDLLGDTRELIALEKAHLARKGCPVVCGEPEIPDALPPFLETLDAPLYAINKNFSVNAKESSWDFLISTSAALGYCGRTERGLPIPNIKLENAALAIQVVQVLQYKNPVSEEVLQIGLKTIKIPGRFERVALAAGEIIYDVAHNPHAARWLAEQLIALPITGKTYAVFGMLQRKDAYHTVKALREVIDVWYLSSLQQEGSYSADEISEHLRALGIKNWYTSNDLSRQLDVVLQVMTNQDRVVVFGSFYTVREAKLYCQNL